MAVPSKADIAKRRQKREDLYKSLNEDGSMTTKVMLSSFRTAVRQVWMKHPSKLALIYDRTIPDMNPDTRTKWLIKCDHCGELFKLTDVEVDHKEGEHSLKTLKDIVPFLSSILKVKHSDLQILCKEDHLNKTYAERHGVTFEEATLIREAVLWEKNGTVATQKKFLESKGYNDVSNKEKRREAYIDYLKALKNIVDNK